MKKHTFCPQCQKLLVTRRAYQILEVNLKKNHSKKAGEIYGIWEARARQKNFFRTPTKNSNKLNKASFPQRF